MSDTLDTLAFASDSVTTTGNDPFKLATRGLCQRIKEKKLRTSSSRKYGIDGNEIGAIGQFPPKKYSIKDDNEESKQCIRELKRRLGNMRSIVVDSNDAVRSEYISTILHAPLFSRSLSTSRKGNHIRWALASLRILFQCESALQVNKKKRTADKVSRMTSTIFMELSQRSLSVLIESALKEDSEDEKEVYKNVKREMEIIVGLLKDRVEFVKDPAIRKQRVQGYFEKQE
ncbi:hypothetical protein GLOIN_2v1780729 [Rhizophagus clarus]|uniref:Uncharacterized protein n=1 Tax=Rhizophagus clarus TaxID=94130 RepID=A0A8H3QBB6_9GLOM|nr:hypothetical protein GLOIN_2v1780729 [Rhizophagus clarus]